MNMPTNCQGLLAQYHTLKSNTTELVMMGPHGILSMKIVISSGGKKVQVFSGYDPGTWGWNDRGPNLADDIWEHQYLQSQERSATKNRSHVVGLEPGIPDSIVAQLDGETRDAVERALIGDEKVQNHWKMFNGVIPGVSSMRGASRDPIIPKSVLAQEKVEDERKQRQLQDADWGRF